jgi:hypothetical protein
MVYFLQAWIVIPLLNLLKRTMTYPGFEPGTFGLAVSIPNRYIHLGRIKVSLQLSIQRYCPLKRLAKVKKYKMVFVRRIS